MRDARHRQYKAVAVTAAAGAVVLATDIAVAIAVAAPTDVVRSFTAVPISRWAMTVPWSQG